MRIFIKLPTILLFIYFFKNYSAFLFSGKESKEISLSHCMSLHCLLEFCVQVLQFILFIFFIFFYFSRSILKPLKNIFIAYLCSGFWAWHESFTHTHTQKKIKYTMCLCVCTIVCVCVCALAGFQCSNNCDCVNLNVSQVIFLHTTDARMAGRGRGCMGGR